MSEQKLSVRAGDEENFVTWPVELPKDDEWHVVDIRLPVRLSKDGETMYLGGTAPAQIFVDGTMVQEISK